MLDKTCRNRLSRSRSCRREGLPFDYLLTEDTMADKDVDGRGVCEH